MREISELVRELSISAPLLYQWRKYEEFGQEVF
jgi:transposase-like protein